MPVMRNRIASSKRSGNNAAIVASKDVYALTAELHTLRCAFIEECRQAL